MALDIYAGPLCRYHAGSWENVAQKAARQSGVAYSILTPDNDGQETAPIAEVKVVVEAWRDHLSSGLAKQDPNFGFTWVEDENGEYFTDRPGWEGYYGLMLAASRLPNEPLPDALPKNLHEDERFLAGEADPSNAPCAQITTRELWLPLVTHIQFDFDYLTRDSMPIGSTFGLLDHLNRLNEDRFHLTADRLAAASMNTPESGASAEAHSVFGLWVFHRIASWATERGMPVILDY